MRSSLLLRSALIVAAILLARLGLDGRAQADAPLPVALDEFPAAFGGWSGGNQPPLDAATRRILAADAYLDRVYVTEESPPVGLYIAYYGSQRHGDAIHSPRNCLPGSGWQPVSQAREAIDTANGRIEANRYLVEKAGRQQLVLYWFQGRGRSVASEYANKFYLMLDAFRLGRTNGALVRIVTPVFAGEPAARDTAIRFIQQFDGLLRRWLP